MKKFLLSLAAMLCIGSAAVAGEIKITTTETKAANSSSKYVTTPFDVEVGDYTFKFDEVNPDNGQMRVNKNGDKGFNLYNTTAIANLKSVTVTADATSLGTWYMKTSNTAAVTSVATTSDTKGVKNNKTITFTVPEGTDASYFHINLTENGSGTVKFTSIVITYAEDVPPAAVATPVISVVEGDRGYSVEMSCETEGAEIYYSTDGTDPTKESNKYNGAIEVWEDATFNAIAYNAEGEASQVATKEVKLSELPCILDSFSPLSDVPEGTKIVVKGTVMTVVYQSGKYLYVKDAYGNYMLLYGSNNTEYSNGNTFSRLEGTFIFSNTLPEINPYTISDVTTGEDAVNPIDTTIDMIGENVISQYFKIENVAISGVSGKDGTMTDADGNSLALYNQFSIDGFANTESNVNVTGFVGIYKGNLQFFPTLIEEYVDPYSAPIFTPADGTEVAKGQIITITAGKDAEIYWRSDAFNMEEDEWKLYTEDEDETSFIPYNAVGNVTFEAYAKYGETVTETVSATYKVGKEAVNAHFYDFNTGEEITEYNMTLGDEPGFTFEAMYMEEFNVTSSNEAVAKFNWDFWGFEIVGAGTTTITVTIPESASYQAGTATLELTVIDPNAPVYYEAWEAVTSIDQLKDGDTVTFMAKEYTGKSNKVEVTYPDVAMAAPAASATVIPVVEMTDGEIPEGALEMTLGITDGGYTFYSEVMEGYLNGTGTKNQAKFTSASKELTLVVNSDGSATVGGVKISSTNYFLQYNPNVSNTKPASESARFAFYTSDSQQKIYMYHKVLKMQAPEGAHTFAAEEVVEGEASVLVVTGVHAESELYYRFTPAEEPEVTTYAVSHEGFTKSETFEAAENNTNTHRIAIDAAGTYELYTYHAASDTKSDITEINVKNTTGVIGIEADGNAADVEYFNLQGIRVDNPANGLYIRRQGNKTTKVIL